MEGDVVAGERRRVFELPASDDVAREIRFHIDMRAEELMKRGWSEESARSEAERLFGDAGEVGAECRSIVEVHRRTERRAGQLDRLRQDVRFGARTLVRQPVFTIVAVLTLALGIGANAAIFGVIEGVLLTPPPYAEPDRLVTIWEVNERGSSIHVTTPNFLDWQAESRSFEAMATHPSYSFGGPTTVLGGTSPVRVWAAWVSADFFRVMGVSPLLGRTFSAEEGAAGAPVAVVSHEFWRNQLGARQDLTAATLRSGGAAIPVIGVMPPGFRYPQQSDVWVPNPLTDGASRSSHNHAVIARLRDGVSPEAAQTEISTITSRLAETYAGDMDAVDARVTPLHDELVGDLRHPLALLLGAAGLVLLIACTNLASTLLARAGARRLEFAVRSSFGAGRFRLIRQLFTESLLLAGLGTVAGLFLAWALLRALVALGTAPALRQATLEIDGRVLAFSILLAVSSAILFGLLPALRLTDGDQGSVLREGGRGAAGPARGRLWNVLVAMEVALALVLLVGSGLLIRSFRQVITVDPGFDARGVLTADLALPNAVYPNDTAVARFHERLLDALKPVPGIEQLGVINHLPLSGSSINGSLEIEGSGESSDYADYRVASEGYFEAMGIPVVRGRAFNARDRIGTPTVALINRTAAQHYFAGDDPVGKRIRNLANEGGYYGDEWLTIVGVVGDVRHAGLLAEPRREVYVSAMQRGLRAAAATLVIRTRDVSPALVSALRERIREIAPDVPIEPQSMQDRIGSSVADRRFSMLVLGTFAALALLLAAVGIYGVVSYGVERRRREMGVRLALGAAPVSVRGLVVRNAMRTVLAGLVLGALGALALTRLLQGMLVGVSRFDPLTFSAVVLLLGVVGFVASWVPARRTTRIDPMITLRTE